MAFKLYLKQNETKRSRTDSQPHEALSPMLRSCYLRPQTKGSHGRFEAYNGHTGLHFRMTSVMRGLNTGGMTGDGKNKIKSGDG